MNKKAQNIVEFYKTTILINLALSLASALFSGFYGFAFCFISFGFISSILMKEVNKKNDYLFYYNNGVTKSQLWVCSFILNIAVILFLKSITLLF